MKKVVVLALAALVLVCAGCSRSPEDRKQQAIARGKQLMEAKDYARAVIEFRNAVQVAPKDAEAHYQLSLALIASGDPRSGIAYLRKTTEINPAHVESQIKLAEVLGGSTNAELLKDAVQRMESVLASSPENPDALAALANAEMKLGDSKDAEEHLARAVEKGPTNLKAAVGLAKVRLGQKKADEAEQILRRATEQKPPQAIAFIVLGQFYMAMKNPAEAKREFGRALEVDKENALALMYLGNLHMATGQPKEAEDVFRRISALSNNSYKPTHALFLLQTGKREEGIKELEALFAATPNDRKLRRYLVTAYTAANRIADAERILDQALSKNKKDTDALLYRSNLLLSRGKYAEAFESVSQVLNFEPNSAAAHYLLAQIHANRGNMQSRRQELSEAVRLNPEFTAARLELVRLLMTSRDSRSALELIDRTPEWQRKNPQVIAQRNWILASMGNKSEMRKGVDTGLSVGRTPDILLQDAVLKLDARDFKGAREQLTELLRKSPEETRALDLLVLSYSAQGQGAAGLSRAREHAAAWPKSARIQHHIGMLLRQNGMPKEARAAFEVARAADASYWAADTGLALLDIAEKKMDSARTRLEPLLSQPAAEIPARILLGQMEQNRNDHAAAAVHYRKVLEVQPDNVFVLNNLAYALTETSNAPDEALKFAERAKELAPDNPTVDDTLGWVLYRRGLHARAVQHFEGAVKRQPNAIRHAHLALAYAARGDSRRGFEQLQAAMKLNPVLPEIAVAQKALLAVK